MKLAVGLLCLPVFAFSAAVKAQTNLLAAFPGSTDAIGSDEMAEPDDDADSATVEKELSLTEREIRSRFAYGVALSGGAAFPWQQVGLQALYLTSPDFTVGLFSGFGRDTLSGKASGISFQQSVSAASAGLTARYYFTSIAPLFIQPMLGYLTWRGTATPHAGDTIAQDSGKTPGSQFLKTAYDAQGLFAGGSLGLATYWENGLYFEYTIWGMGSGWILADDFGQNEPTAKAFIRSNLKKTVSWGVVNATLGYFF